MKSPPCVVDRWRVDSLTRKPKGLFAVSWPRQLGQSNVTFQYHRVINPIFSEAPPFSGNLNWANKLRVSEKLFRWYLFLFVEYFCNHSPNMGTKTFRNNVSILAIINYQNWLIASPPLKVVYNNSNHRVSNFMITLNLILSYRKKFRELQNIHALNLTK